ncbi:hypothetical protein LQL77_31800 [Rhodococcus cerastii]|nr:hypothetical protein [Rhodococcus cerastii]
MIPCILDSDNELTALPASLTVVPATESLGAPVRVAPKTISVPCFEARPQIGLDWGWNKGGYTIEVHHHHDSTGTATLVRPVFGTLSALFVDGHHSDTLAPGQTALLRGTGQRATPQDLEFAFIVHDQRVHLTIRSTLDGRVEPDWETDTDHQAMCYFDPDALDQDGYLTDRRSIIQLYLRHHSATSIGSLTKL